MGGAVAAIGGAVLGGVAGSQKDKASKETISSQESRLVAAPETEQERQAREMAFRSVQDLEKRLQALEASPVISNLDRLLSELGAPPTASRIAQAEQYAQQVFAPRREALAQAMEQQTAQASQRAAQLGRSIADPILAAKLAQEQIRQQSMLSAEQSSLAAQEAINAPARQFQAQLSGIGGLSAQAIQNRQAVYSLGSDFATNLQQFRLATGTQYGSGRQNVVSTSGGGLKGAITGAMGGAAMGIGMGQALGGFGGGGGGGGLGMMGGPGGTGTAMTLAGQREQAAMGAMF